MLSNSMIMPTIPITDLEKARKFYEGTLGLKPLKDNPYGVIYECADGTAVLIYPSAGAGTSKGTYAAWKVDDLEEEMDDLLSKGVKFEEYDMPGLKTVDGIATDGDMRSAWFKDPDGNILALTETGEE